MAIYNKYYFKRNEKDHVDWGQVYRHAPQFHPEISEQIAPFELKEAHIREPIQGGFKELLMTQESGKMTIFFKMH